ncbi:MAG: sigma-70 family RNA polymerase sigma factor [Chloroflexi bacterium]|nr:sigma-70 family RNA polymerase sigma factor [Chloroflexota bacterium]
MASEFISEGIAVPAPQESGGEAELIRLAKARSREAWTAIYEENYRRLFRYVYGRVGHRQTAEDLTAAVFVEALKSIDGYASRGRPLLAWLYTIARNVVNYHYRSTFRRGAKQTLGESGESKALSGAADPASLAEGWDLRAAVDRLSADQREVVLLRYFVGLTTPQVARVLGKQERAVYSLQARAVKALRRHLT